MSQDPNDGKIVELAFHITELTNPWTHLGSIEHRIAPDPDYEALVLGMADDLRDMYTECGVLDLLKHGAHAPMDDVEQDIIEFFGRFGEPGDYILAGRHIWMYEKPWLDQWMPGLSSWFQGAVDISPISYIIAQAGLSDVLEPSFREPMKYRAHNFAERFCIEFMFYTELLKTVPLKRDYPEQAKAQEEALFPESASSC